MGGRTSGAGAASGACSSTSRQSWRSRETAHAERAGWGGGEEGRGTGKIGDQLSDGRGRGGAWEEDRIIKAPGRKAAAGIGIYGGQAEIGVGEQRRAGFPYVLVSDQGAQFANRDLGIIFQGDGFGLCQRQFPASGSGRSRGTQRLRSVC